MDEKRSVPGEKPWDEAYGYSRALRRGNIIFVSGTTAPSKNDSNAKSPVYAQTVSIIKRIEAALAELGATLDDVVRTRTYTRDISKWEEIAKAHAEFFGATKPTATLVEVSNLIEPDALLEMEVDAIVVESARARGLAQRKS